MQSDKRAESPAPKGPRIEERTVEETVAEMNNPPVPTPTQAEADALLEGEPASEAMGRANETEEQRQAREKQQRDMKPGASPEPYRTR
jgi:ribosomal protein L12E/L44/L45/RPP1/RPP2